jgi:CrcB protein
MAPPVTNRHGVCDVAAVNQLEVRQHLCLKLDLPARRDRRSVCRASGSTAMMPAWLPYRLVGLGGFLGANARFVVARSVGGMIDTRFPLGTFAINMSGSFLLGVVGSLVAQRVSPVSDGLRLAIGIGFIGAYTTFSTFEFETHALLETGELAMALVNMIGSLVVGMLALRAGVLVTRWWII